MMQSGEHSKGGAADTAQGGVHAPATAETAGGVAPSGWLDRVALHSRSALASEGTLRPRLPYPFEAMRFATADAGPQLPHAAGLPASPADASATTVSADSAAGLAMPAMTDPPAPRVAAAPAPVHIRSDVPVSVSPKHERPALRQEQRHLASPRSAGERELPSPEHEPAPMDKDVRSPTMPRSRASEPPLPAHPARLAPSALAGQRLGLAPPTASATVPMKARLADHGSEQATPRQPSPQAGSASLRKADAPFAGPAQPAAAKAAQPALRGAPPINAPLAARPSVEAAPEITIDIHIGRIDVRAPAGAAPAPPAVPAPAQRGGDALNAYLARRARGARS